MAVPILTRASICGWVMLLEFKDDCRFWFPMIAFDANVNTHERVLSSEG